MVQMHTQHQPESIIQRGDDFTQIKGIGSAIQIRLYSANILTFSQLGAFSPEKIAASVPGLSAKRIARENWIRQARNLAKKAHYPKTINNKPINERRQHYATFTIELLLVGNNNVRRTRVTDVYTKTEERWDGWSEQRLLSFIKKYAGLSIPMPTPVIVPKSMSSIESSSSINTSAPIQSPKTENDVIVHNPILTDSLSGTLRIIELRTGPLVSGLPNHLTQVNEAFDVRLILDLAKINVMPPNYVDYTATIWAKKLGTGARQLIGERSGIFTSFEQSTLVVQCTIPFPGTFRLEATVIITLESCHISPLPALRAWAEGSLLHVY
jgi:hypothetical protein